MKTLDELYSEVKADGALAQEYMTAAENGTVGGFLSVHGCEATEQELSEFLGGLDKHGELSDDELDDVSAGKKCGTLYHDSKPVVTAMNSCDRWRCHLCGCTKREKHKNTHTPGIVSGHHCNTCEYYKLSGMLYLCEHPARRNN